MGKHVAKPTTQKLKPLPTAEGSDLCGAGRRAAVADFPVGEVPVAATGGGTHPVLPILRKEGVNNAQMLYRLVV